MNCIFCKKVSDDSKSVEHIVPESLGNTDHCLPKGIVCDKCNNYFASKIEQPVLEKPYFKNMRHRNFIRSKRGRLVPGKALFPHKDGGWADIRLDEKGFIFDPKDEHIINLIKTGKINSLIIPTIRQPEENDPQISRFLAKMGLEFLALKFAHDSGWLNNIASEKELDPIRNYVRLGNKKNWKYHQRRIYEEEDRFIDVVNHLEPYEILHEFDFLFIERRVMYFVIVFMGIEFAINMMESETNFYIQWLEENDGISPVRRPTEFIIPKNQNDT